MMFPFFQDEHFLWETKKIRFFFHGIFDAVSNVQAHVQQIQV